MRTFLSKYMSAEALDELENAYKNANAGATGLPVYIPKSRFDEENTKRKNAEQLVAGFEEDKKKAVREAVEKYKDIPDDWKQQLDNATNALATQKADYEAKLTAAKQEADVTAKIYGAGGKNVKAIRALIDLNQEATVDEQLAALKESDSYLFNRTSGFKKGTDKDDDGGKQKEDGALSQAAMYRAVGITPPMED